MLGTDKPLSVTVALGTVTFTRQPRYGTTPGIHPDARRPSAGMTEAHGLWTLRSPRRSGWAWLNQLMGLKSRTKPSPKKQKSHSSSA